MLFLSVHRASLRRTLLAALPAVAAFACLPASAQNTPIPFAGTVAGGGTVCAASIPAYFPTGGAGTQKNVGDGCPATQAVLNAPVTTVVDSFGNLFIADQNPFLVRVVYNGGTALANAIVAANPQATALVPIKGNIYTIVGGPQGTPAITSPPYYCSESVTTAGPAGLNRQLDGCPGGQAYVQPRGLGLDADGNLFISNVGGTSGIRVFYIGGTAAAKLIALETPSVTNPLPGYTYPIAGTTGSAFTGDGALASKAGVNTPRGIFVDANENIYFADNLNNTVRRIDSTTGFISTIAGHCVASGANCTATNTSGDGSPATNAVVNIYSPYGVVLDAFGNVFIAEGGSATLPGRIRVVYAGGTLPGITSPVVGNIYTYAGGGAVTGTPAQMASFNFAYGVAIDPAGFLYVTDYRSGTAGSNHIWRVDPTTGNIVVIAGSGGSALTTGARCNGSTTGPTATNTRGDGCPATQAYLNTPQEGVTFDARGTFYVADRNNNVIRSFTYNNLFPATAVGSSVTQPVAFLYPGTSVPVTDTFSLQGAATTEYADAGGNECAVNTTIAVTSTCVNYVKFTPSAAGGRIGSLTVNSATAVIGTQSLSGVGVAPVLAIDPGTQVALGTAITPNGVSTDATGNVYLSDSKGKQVLKTTIAGGAATPLLTGLGTPQQSSIDPFGNFYVADSGNNNIARLSAAGTSSTVGTALSGPKGVAADQLGNVYIADTGNNRLLYYSPATGNQIAISLTPYTLSAPTSLALDSTGDLFILDSGNARVIELPVGATAQLVALPTGTVPSALSLDAAGDLYLADKATGSVIVVPAGSTTGSTLVTGLTTPTGVAIGVNGNLFVADAAATSGSGYNRSLNATTFATTNIGLTSLPATLTLTSLGNAPLTLSTPSFTETGSAAAFISSGTPTCTAGLVMTPFATCTQSFVFKPSVVGPQSAQAIFSSTTGQSVTANFSSTATNLILTTTTVALQSPANGVVNYGIPAIYTVTMTPNTTGSSAPTGTITFVVDGQTNATKTLSSNPYTFTVALGVGTHTIAAVYSGDSLYAGSNASTSITVGKAPTTTTASFTQNASGVVLGAVMTPSSTGSVTFSGNIVFTVDGLVKATVPVGNGTVSTTVLLADGAHTYVASYVGDVNYAGSTSATQNITIARAATTVALTSTPTATAGVAGLLLSAKVSSSGTGTPSGTIVFSNGATTLGTVTLANGAATWTTTTLTYTNYSFTATYSGDGLFQPSTITITQGADFDVVASTLGLTIPNGSQAIAPVVVSPINGYTGSLKGSCSNLPVNAICRFLPGTLTISGTTASALSVQVFVGIDPATASVTAPAFGNASRSFFALLLLTPLAFGLRRRSRTATVLGVMLLFISSTMLTGCGQNKTPAAPTASFVTPVGVNQINVTVTDANGLSRSSVLTVTVSSL